MCFNKNQCKGCSSKCKDRLHKQEKERNNVEVAKCTLYISVPSLIIILLLVFFTSKSEAIELKDFDLSIGASQSKLNYDWYGASQATFEFDLTVIRVEAAHKSGFAVRYGYGLPMGTNQQTTITNQTLVIDFNKYREYELLYKYSLTDSIRIYGGIGYYQQTLPIYSTSGSLIHHDKDDDSGLFIGAEYQLTNKLSLDLFIKQTSKIGDGGSCDITCQNNWVAKGSTIRQVGLGIIYKY